MRKDGVALGQASLDSPLPVDPGEHVVVVEAPGTRATQFRASVGEGEQIRLEVSVGPDLPRAQSGPGPVEGRRESSAGRSAAYVIGGIGVAGLITGVFTGLSVLSHKSTVDDNCVGKQCNQAGLDAAQSGKTLGIVTTVALVSGALGLGTASYLFLAAPAPTENAHSGAYQLGIRAKW